MFNKPNLFPKVPDSTAGRTARPGGAMSPASGGNASINSGAGSLSATPDSPAATSLAPAAAASIPEASAPGDSASQLIVGPDVKLKGAEILDCDTLVVEGRVEAMMDSRVIRIAEAGAFSGKVGIDVAEIWGVFDGELTARQQLIIHSTGRVSGKIRYGRILIEEGGEVSGDVQPLSSADKGERRPQERQPSPDARPLAAVAS